MPKNKRSYFPQTIVLLLIVFFLVLASLSQAMKDNLSVVEQLSVSNLLTDNSFSSTPTPTLTPKRIPAPIRSPQAYDPVLSARAVLVIDRSSKDVLFRKNEDMPLWPASTTKVMTALVALDEYELSDIVTVSNPVSQGRIMDLYVGERITVRNLLYGLLIHSANDAAYALSDFYSQGREGFVSRMNEKAKELDLVNTHFVDPAGFDNDKQYSTATDLALLTDYAMENDTIAQIISIPLITISDADYIVFHRLQNVNQLLGVVPGVVGGKTGYTVNAKENLINITRREGHEIMTIVLGSDDRFGETKLLTEWIFDNYSWPDSTFQSTLDR